MWNRSHTQMAYAYRMSSAPKNSFINGTAGIDYQRIGRHEKRRMISFSVMYRFGWLKQSATKRARHGINNNDLKR